MPALALAPAIPLMVALMGLLIAAGLGGCLEEAADKDFKFDNPLDNTPSDGDDDVGTLAITFVEPNSDIVIIVNGSGSDREMTNWTLENVGATEEFTFPTFILKAGNVVRVHTMDTTTADDPDDVYATTGGTTIDWQLTDDSATLRNSSGTVVNTCIKGESCWP